MLKDSLECGRLHGTFTEKVFADTEDYKNRRIGLFGFGEQGRDSLEGIPAPVSVIDKQYQRTAPGERRANLGDCLSCSRSMTSLSVSGVCSVGRAETLDEGFWRGPETEALGELSQRFCYVFASGLTQALISPQRCSHAVLGIAKAGVFHPQGPGAADLAYSLAQPLCEACLP